MVNTPSHGGSFPPLTADGFHYIVAGQHSFAAASVVREEAVGMGQEPPAWTTRFRCLKIIEKTPTEVIEVIAGRQQARSELVLHTGAAEKIRMLLRAHRARPTASKKELLESVWLKGGGTEHGEGGAVCCVLPWHCGWGGKAEEGGLGTLKCDRQVLWFFFTVGNGGQWHAWFAVGVCGRRGG
jgi:hypothetical protein